MTMTAKERANKKKLDDCLDDLKKFYGYRHTVNTIVNTGRRGNNLAGNILKSYSPSILRQAFYLLPGLLRTNSEDIVKGPTSGN